MPADGDLTELVKHLGLVGMPADLPLAMVHRSYSYENGRIPTNERLEFLGDSVLGVIITDHLYRNFPDLP
ncbi:MAG TPA: ribonuclease III domain-containing protein, partial [Actinomycetota bacterium]|nr:ribonuclease III domain-containing protein [Actinomycetota bacterium]